MFFFVLLCTHLPKKMHVPSFGAHFFTQNDVMEIDVVP